MTLTSNSIRRARPALGTIVEIQASGQSRQMVDTAITAAFDAITLVEKLMSFHNPESELSLLNRCGHLRAVKLHPWTYEVLREAKRFWVESRGLFDVTVARLLETSGVLPRHQDYPAVSPEDRGEAIELLPRSYALLSAPVRIDLGGIAKGFAVDKAVEILQDAGMSAGLVNAGGDLRAFGADPQPIHVRIPENPQETFPLLSLCNGAIATSASYFSPYALVDPRTQRCICPLSSVTVIAPSCIAADSLTKVAILDSRTAANLFPKYEASGWCIGGALGELSLTPLDSEARSGYRNVAMKLPRWQKIALLTSFAVLWLTGVAWLIADSWGPTTPGSALGLIKHWLMRGHGLFTFSMLFFLGVITEHFYIGVKGTKNRRSGLSMLAIGIILALSGWLLYYASGESTRSFASTLHWVLGALTPLLVLTHLRKSGR